MMFQHSSAGCESSVGVGVPVVRVWVEGNAQFTSNIAEESRIARLGRDDQTARWGQPLLEEHAGQEP